MSRSREQGARSKAEGAGAGLVALVAVLGLTLPGGFLSLAECPSCPFPGTTIRNDTIVLAICDRCEGRGTVSVWNLWTRGRTGLDG